MPRRYNKGTFRHDVMRGSRFQSVGPQPPNTVRIEAKRAHTQADREPLRYVFGDPLPGRSALDKMRQRDGEL